MPRLLIAAALFAAAPFLVSAEQPDGWRGLRWGMTAAEVEAALPGETSRDDKGELGIPSFEVDRRAYEVTFKFDDGQRLRAVALESTTAQPAAAPHFALSFEGLERLLAEKYGPPVSKTDDQGGLLGIVTRKRSWSSATTVIRLTYTKVPGVGTKPGFEGILLSYSAPDADASKL